MRRERVHFGVAHFERPLAFSAGVGVAFAAFGQPGVVRSLHLRGDAAPDLVSHEFFSFDTPTLGPTGTVAYRAQLGFPGLRGVWRSSVGTPASAELIALEGEAAPGASGSFLAFSPFVAINSEARVAFWATTDETGEQGIWVGSSSAALAAWVMAGDSASIGGAEFVNFTIPEKVLLTSPLGTSTDTILAFFAETNLLDECEGEVPVRGFWSHDNVGSPSLVYRDGQKSLVGSQLYYARFEGEPSFDAYREGGLGHLDASWIGNFDIDECPAGSSSGYQTFGWCSEGASVSSPVVHDHLPLPCDTSCASEVLWLSLTPYRASSGYWVASGTLVDDTSCTNQDPDFISMIVEASGPGCSEPAQVVVMEHDAAPRWQEPWTVPHSRSCAVPVASPDDFNGSFLHPVTNSASNLVFASSVDADADADTGIWARWDSGDGCEFAKIVEEGASSYALDSGTPTNLADDLVFRDTVDQEALGFFGPSASLNNRDQFAFMGAFLNGASEQVVLGIYATHVRYNRHYLVVREGSQVTIDNAVWNVTDLRLGSGELDMSGSAVVVKSRYIPDNPENGTGTIDDCGNLVFWLRLSDAMDNQSEGIFHYRIPHPADLSGSSDTNSPDYGVPDGLLDTSDFFTYLDLWAASVGIADYSGDGTVDTTDFFEYLDSYAEAGYCYE